MSTNALATTTAKWISWTRHTRPRNMHLAILSGSWAAARSWQQRSRKQAVALLQGLSYQHQMCWTGLSFIMYVVCCVQMWSWKCVLCHVTYHHICFILVCSFAAVSNSPCLILIMILIISVQQCVVHVDALPTMCTAMCVIGRSWMHLHVTVVHGI